MTFLRPLFWIAAEPKTLHSESMTISGGRFGSGTWRGTALPSFGYTETKPYLRVVAGRAPHVTDRLRVTGRFPQSTGKVCSAEFQKSVAEGGTPVPKRPEHPSLGKPRTE